MRNLKFNCPACRQAYDWNDEYQGNKLQCASCNSKFFVNQNAGKVSVSLVSEGNDDVLDMTAQAQLSCSEIERLLSYSLNAKLFGRDLRTDLYSHNSFRLLGLSASSDRQKILTEGGKLQTLIRLSPKAINRFAIDIGYEHQLRKDDIELSVSRLQDPRHRIVQELFWLHLDQESLPGISDNQKLFSPEGLEALIAMNMNSNGDQESALVKHVIAIVCHNLALTGEINFLKGESNWDPALWEKALFYWGQIIEEKSFWDYLRNRARAFADPRLQSSDIDQLRQDLPAVLLGFNFVFGRHYGQTENHEMCRNHLKLISKADFPNQSVNTCLRSGVKELAAMRLEPLVRRAKNSSHKKKKKKKETKLSRQQFEELYRPIMEEAFAIHYYLTDQIKLDQNLVSLSEFDQLAEAILMVLNTKIDYDLSKEELIKNIMYSMLFAKKMLVFPLSNHIRRKIDGTLRKDRKTLYQGFEPPDDIDITECWFAEGEEADPDASLLFPYYKITNRNVQVNALKETAGVSVNYQSRQIMVPRSARAKAFHEGKSLEDLPSRRKADNGLFSPPKTEKIEPFFFSKKNKASTILEVLEYCSNNWSRGKKFLEEGSLPNWFEQRGQTALAAKLRTCNKDKADKSALHVLRYAAATEVETGVKEAESEANSQIHEIESNAAEKKLAIQKERNAQIRQYDESFAEEKAGLNEQLKKIKSESGYKREITQKQATEAIKAERETAAQNITQAEQKYQRSTAHYRGTSGMLRWDLPFALIAILCGIAAGHLVPFDLRNDIFQATGISAEINSEIIFAAGAAVLFASITLTGVNIYKSIYRKLKFRPVKKLKQKTEMQCTEILDSCKTDIADIETEENAKSEKVEAQLQKLTEERNQLIQTAESKLKQVAEESRKAVEECRDLCSQKIEMIKPRLDVFFVIKPKKEGKKFPAIKKAKSNGYKEGLEPSAYELQMTPSEEEEARSQLLSSMFFNGHRF